MQTKQIQMEYSWKYSGEWPYNGMVNDLWRGIQAEENYLVALGLFAYSEALGRMILGTVGNKEKDKGWEAYQKFTGDFVGYIFSDWKKLFDFFRNGLAHQYFIKASGSIVYNDAGDKTCGIDTSGNSYVVYVHTYFLHFVQGLEKALNNKKL